MTQAATKENKTQTEPRMLREKKKKRLLTMMESLDGDCNRQAREGGRGGGRGGNGSHSQWWQCVTPAPSGLFYTPCGYHGLPER